ncbi:hypothetical protein AAMO2058_000041300 [Amorphochlora amoebiformis]
MPSNISAFVPYSMFIRKDGRLCWSNAGGLVISLSRNYVSHRTHQIRPFVASIYRKDATSHCCTHTMAEAKPDMKTVLAAAKEAKLNKTVVKESSTVSDRTKLLGTIKSNKAKKDLTSAQDALKKAEDKSKRAMVQAYKAEKKEAKK